MSKLFKLYGEDIAIDLGTSNVLLGTSKNKILINEPSVVALNVNNYDIVAVGKEASDMIGKTPENILAVTPIEEGVIADFQTAQAMMTYIIRKAISNYFLFQPRLIITIPSSLTDVEKRAVKDVAFHSGAREVFLIEETVATAVGLGLDVEKPMGHLIVNAGGGTVDVSVVSLNGIVCSKSIKMGGEKIDKDIVSLIKRQFNLSIGMSTAEEIKIKIATLNKYNEDKSIVISGKNVITGMPENAKVYAKDLINIIYPIALDIIDAIRTVLEKTPPELAGDIGRSGLYLAGGLGQLNGLKEFISNELRLGVNLANQPMKCTCTGCLLYFLKNIKFYKNKKGKIV